MDTRTEAQILAGKVADAGPIMLGGKAYAVREPSLIRTQNIMSLQAEYQDMQSRMDTLSAPEQLSIVNTIMVRMVREFSAEIDEDWPRIEAEASTEELLNAVEIVSRVVSAPFVRRAIAATVPPNRESRRKTKAKK